MINAVHMLLYSQDPAADRAFLRDELGFSYVDTGGDWLIFKLPPAEVGVHLAGDGGGTEFYFMCDDLDATLADLMAKGVELVTPPSDEGWGKVTAIRLPGGAQVGLYQPLHQVAYDL